MIYFFYHWFLCLFNIYFCCIVSNLLIDFAQDLRLKEVINKGKNSGKDINHLFKKTYYGGGKLLAMLKICNFLKSYPNQNLAWFLD